MPQVDTASAYAIIPDRSDWIPTAGFRFNKKARKGLERIRRGAWRKIEWDEWQAIARGAGYRQAESNGGSQQLWLWEADQVGLVPSVLSEWERGHVLTLHPHAPHGSRSEAWPLSTEHLMTAVALIDTHLAAEARLDEEVVEKLLRHGCLGRG